MVMFEKLQGPIGILFFTFFSMPSVGRTEEPCYKTTTESYIA